MTVALLVLALAAPALAADDPDDLVPGKIGIVMRTRFETKTNYNTAACSITFAK